MQTRKVPIENEYGQCKAQCQERTPENIHIVAIKKVVRVKKKKNLAIPGACKTRLVPLPQFGALYLYFV